MSRPWSSVPSTYFQLPCAIHTGGRRESDSSSVLRSNGLCGATQPANSAQNVHTSAISAARMATGEDRKLWATSLSYQRKKVFCMARNGLLLSNQ